MGTSSQLLLNFLLNACWQIALIAAVATFCDWLLRGTTARRRNWLWVTALILSLGLPALTSSRALDGKLSRKYPRPLATVQQSDAILIPLPSEIALDETTALAAPFSILQKKTGAIISVNQGLASALIALYLLFLCYRGLRLLNAWRKTQLISRSAYAVDFPEHIQTTIRQCQAAIGVTQVRVLCSTSLVVPVTVGTLKPLILLPEQLSREADANVLTAAIGHELVHIRRHDYLLNLIYELLYLPLSFHPAAWLVRRRINQTRELGCDELISENLLAPEVYARSLVQLAGAARPLRRSATTITVGIADADILEERVMTMLKRSKTNVGKKSWMLVAATLCFALPCLAAAPFALRINISSHSLAAASAVTPLIDVTPQSQEAKQSAQEGKSNETRERSEAREMALKLQAEREAQSLEEKLRAAAATSQQDPERMAKVKRDLEKRDLEDHILQERRMIEEEKLAHVERDLQEPEIMAKRQAERKARAERQNELAKLAQVSMDRAIQIATSQQPGTVMECSLVGERGQVFYNVVILPTDAAETRKVNTPEGTKTFSVNIIQIVQVNAVDGQIIRAVKEDR